MGRYLVTGGAGFIGSNIVRRLISRGDEVVVIDDLSSGRESNIPPGVSFVNIDISRQDDLSQIPNGHYDAALHLAAQASGELSHEAPSRDLEISALGTLYLLGWCRSNRVSRFLSASSMAVYGLVDRVPVREADPADPYSFYGIAKQAAEQYVRHYAKSGMHTTILRMFSVYGPGQDLSNMKQGMLSIYLEFLKRGGPILVRGSLDRFRDFIHIEDVVEGWVAALDNINSHGRVYNLASGKKTVVRDLLSQLIAAWGDSPDTHPIEQGEDTPGDQFGVYADISLISSELEWQPRVSLAEGVRGMVDWAKALPVGHTGR